MNHSPDMRSEGLGSDPHDPRHPSEIQDASEFRAAFGLTQREVDRLRDIIRRECGVELTNEEAWARAIELVAFGRALTEAGPPNEHYQGSRSQENPREG